MRNDVDTSRDVEILVLTISAAGAAQIDPRSIEREIQRLPGVRTVLVNVSAEAVLVEYQPAQLDASYVVAAALNLGCRAEPYFGW